MVDTYLVNGYRLLRGSQKLTLGGLLQITNKCADHCQISEQMIKSIMQGKKWICNHILHIAPLPKKSSIFTRKIAIEFGSYLTLSIILWRSGHQK